MAERNITCLRCQSAMKLWHKTSLEARDAGIFMTQNWIDVEIYACPACGKLEFFQPESETGKDEIGTGSWWNWKYVRGSGPDRKCPQCGKWHPEDDAFCPGCGKLKTKMISCAWCGKEFPAGERACPHCGSRQGSE